MEDKARRRGDPQAGKRLPVSLKRPAEQQDAVATPEDAQDAGYPSFDFEIHEKMLAAKSAKFIAFVYLPRNVNRKPAASAMMIKSMKTSRLQLVPMAMRIGVPSA